MESGYDAFTFKSEPLGTLTHATAITKHPPTIVTRSTKRQQHHRAPHPQQTPIT